VNDYSPTHPRQTGNPPDDEVDRSLYRVRYEQEENDRWWKRTSYVVADACELGIFLEVMASKHNIVVLSVKMMKGCNGHVSDFGRDER
jgi:tRNA uridine 5-carbamoylmethylation protein Kti12